MKISNGLLVGQKQTLVKYAFVTTIFTVVLGISFFFLGNLAPSEHAYAKDEDESLTYLHSIINNGNSVTLNGMEINVTFGGEGTGVVDTTFFGKNAYGMQSQTSDSVTLLSGYTATIDSNINAITNYVWLAVEFEQAVLIDDAITLVDIDYFSNFTFTASDFMAVVGYKNNTLITPTYQNIGSMVETATLAVNNWPTNSAPRSIQVVQNKANAFSTAIDISHPSGQANATFGSDSVDKIFVFYGIKNSVADAVTGTRYSGVKIGDFNSLAASALPVELISFTGVKKESSHLLYWSTATELNNDYFEVQRKESGEAWYVLGEVVGNGTSSSINHYTFEDFDVMPGVTYIYRLKQLDFDGAFEYSNLLVVNEDMKTLDEVKVGPVPARDYLIVNSKFNEDVKMDIVDQNGLVVKTNFLRKDAYTHQVVVSGLRSGTYFARINNQVTKIIKE